MTRIVARVERSETRERHLSRTCLPRIALRSIRATARFTPAGGDFDAAALKQERLLRQRIFVSEIRFLLFGHGRPRKFNGSHTRNARFSVVSGAASAQFRCCLTRLRHPLTGAPSRSRKGRQPVTPTDGVGA